MNKYQITLKSGVSQILDNLGDVKNPIGLWIWSSNQASVKILTFKDEATQEEVAINSKDIAMIVKVEPETPRYPRTQDEEEDMYIRKYNEEENWEVDNWR